MFTDPTKSNNETKFTDADIIDKKIEIPEVKDGPYNNLPVLTDGLLSIGSSPVFNNDECKTYKVIKVYSYRGVVSVDCVIYD
jgi:hypothetical protein